MLLLHLTLLLNAAAALLPWSTNPVPLGEHRALITAKSGAATWVLVPWARRFHPDTATTDLILVAWLSSSSKSVVVTNAVRAPVSNASVREATYVVFEPVAGATDYALYYMPFTRRGKTTGITLEAIYTQRNETASPAWLTASGLTRAVLASGAFKTKLPQSVFTGLDAFKPFHAFSPMETPSTAAAVAAMLAKHGGAAAPPVLFFPTNRTAQAMMADELPQAWAATGPSRKLIGDAVNGELYAFQVGVWVRGAASFAIPADGVTWSALIKTSAAAKGGGAAPATIDATRVTCYNMGGTDYRGHPFAQATLVAAGSIKALWFGVDVPVDAEAGTYTGTIAVKGVVGKAAFEATLAVTLAVTLSGGKGGIANGGADDLWRMARLKWLDSSVGIDRNTTSDGDRRLAPLILTSDPSVSGGWRATLGGGRTLSLLPSEGGAEGVCVVAAIAVGAQTILGFPSAPAPVPAPAPYDCMASWKETKGEFIRGSGTASGDIGFGESCGPARPHDYPAMTLHDIKQNCCDLGKGCYAFSWATSQDPMAAGKACARKSPGGGYIHDAHFNGYEKSPLPPTPSPTPPPTMLPTPGCPAGLVFQAQDIAWKKSGPLVVLQRDAMTATLSSLSASSNSALTLNTTIVVSYDGFVDVMLSLSTPSGAKNIVLTNASLTYTMPSAASTFFMGIGVEGRNRSASYPTGVRWAWKANDGKGQNLLWAGSTRAGLRLKLKGASPNWESPLHIQAAGAAPAGWGGDGGTGGIAALPATEGGLIVTAWSGALTVRAAAPLDFKFDFLVTPIKTLDTPRHFKRDRYYQYGYNGLDKCPAIATMGVKVLNLHQGVDLNPYINYPFVLEKMALQANFSRWCKHLGVESVKIYYTTRELSNRCHEAPALRMLSSPTDTIFDSGSGGGGAWLQEHLQGGYHVRWSTTLSGGAVDEAIADTGLSRWVNYYVAGLEWLVQSHGPNTSAIDVRVCVCACACCALCYTFVVSRPPRSPPNRFRFPAHGRQGVYLDELSFGRSTLQRMRKAVDRDRSGALFDLHSCNKFHCGQKGTVPGSCSALLYMAHFVFIDSLWFGEGFSPNYSPDQWLVEMSGIPFGMHAEQLSSPNLWRGMVFAEGGRPAPELWTAWDTLGLTDEGVRLVGWWEPSPVVRTSAPTVVWASTYVRPHTVKGGVIAVASWAEKGHATNVTLSIDWAQLGLTAATATITAHAIAGFQPQMVVDPSSAALLIPGEQGFLLDVRPKA